ncbi:hypothetical protein [Streptomyces sp.]|uniref:hypothetical protein n=1 Tax=Streptomyces sp. TaxID=1931 RepID=UPI002D78A81F|nr:hypothetical protein [Streptomyces sp.]HET6355939.1 hypothetical protein [Streptomyces sp.]
MRCLSPSLGRWHRGPDQGVLGDDQVQSGDPPRPSGTGASFADNLLRRWISRFKPSADPLAGIAGEVPVVDRDDIVAARPHLTEFFGTNQPPPWAQIDSTYTVDNGASPHRANFYLTKAATGQAIADAM